jgi:hypothetical protein
LRALAKEGACSLDRHFESTDPAADEKLMGRREIVEPIIRGMTDPGSWSSLTGPASRSISFFDTAENALAAEPISTRCPRTRRSDAAVLGKPD